MVSSLATFHGRSTSQSMYVRTTDASALSVCI